MNLGHVVRLGIYATDVDEALKNFDLMGMRFGPHRVAPPMTLLGVTRLAIPGLHSRSKRLPPPDADQKRLLPEKLLKAAYLTWRPAQRKAAFRPSGRSGRTAACSNSAVANGSSVHIADTQY